MKQSGQAHRSHTGRTCAAYSQGRNKRAELAAGLFSIMLEEATRCCRFGMFDTEIALGISLRRKLIYPTYFKDPEATTE
jgi:hypothetical protein